MLCTIIIGIFVKFHYSEAMENTLAIVIPAYKPAFLDLALKSIAAQTDRDFVLYVGDDASPHDVKSVLAPYEGQFPLVYHRFPQNLGGKDLVGQWERCMGLVENENWIYLFSDDDVMPTDAVERFHAAVSGGGEFFRFPLDTVDSEGNIQFVHTSFSAPKTTAEDYLKGYLAGHRPSAACEYIFSKRLFREGPMVHFPLAWCSDIASWYSYASRAGAIVNLEGAPVLWRNADGVNISNSTGLEDVKMEALIQFVTWLSKEYKGVPDNEYRRALRIFISTNLKYSFGGKFSRKNLLRLSRAFAATDRRRAFEILVNNIL